MPPFSSAWLDCFSYLTTLPKVLSTENHRCALEAKLLQRFGLCLLAHAATRQGEVAAQNACGQNAVYHNEQVPSAIYTRPEIACVGLSKQSAQEQGIDLKSHKAFLLASGRAQAQDETEGYFELLSNRQTGQLLGANFCGANATELIHIVSAMLAADMTVQTAQEIIFAHPTLAESIGDALHK